MGFLSTGLGTQKHRIPLFDFSSLRLWFLGLGPSEALVTGTQADLLHGSVFSECNFPLRGPSPKLNLRPVSGFPAVGDFSSSQKIPHTATPGWASSPGSSCALLLDHFGRFQLEFSFFGLGAWCSHHPKMWFQTLGLKKDAAEGFVVFKTTLIRTARRFWVQNNHPRGSPRLHRLPWARAGAACRPKKVPWRWPCGARGRPARRSPLRSGYWSDRDAVRI